MATLQAFPTPDLKYGWLPEYAEKNRVFSLRPGQWFCLIPRMVDTPNSKYLSSGVTHLLVNNGQMDTSIPFAQRAILDPGVFLGDALGGFAGTSGWTQSQINNAIDARVNAGLGCAFYADQIGEWGGNHGGLTVDQWNPTNQQRWWAQRLGQRIGDLGGRFYGGYDGHMDLPRGEIFDNETNMRNALGSDSAALNLAKNGNASPFGNDFYIADAYQWRHGCIKIYHIGDANTHKWLMGKLVGLEVDIRARRAVNTNRRVAAVAFPGYSETLGEERFSTEYRFAVPSTGGYFKRPTFPIWSVGLQHFLYFYALARDFDLFNWETEVRYGRNPNVLPADSGPMQYVGPGSPTRATEAFAYDPTRPTPYPPNPQGVLDIPCVAAEMYAYCHQNQHYDFVFTPHSINGGTATTVGTDYLYDRYLDKKGVCMLGGSGNYRWVAYCNSGLGSGQSQEVTVNLQASGATATFTAFGNNLHVFRVQL